MGILIFGCVLKKKRNGGTMMDHIQNPLTLPNQPQWEAHNANIISWILSSKDPQIFLDLQSYKTAEGYGSISRGS